MPLEVACNVFDADTEEPSAEKRKACSEAHGALTEVVGKLDKALGTNCLHTCALEACTEDSCETLRGAAFAAANVLAIDLTLWQKVLVNGVGTGQDLHPQQLQLAQAAWKELETLLSDTCQLMIVDSFVC